MKIRVGLGDRAVEAVALVSSGFETEGPQLLVPYSFLVKNDVNPEDLGRPTVVEYDTAGGPVAMHVYPGACAIAVVEEDRGSKGVKADLAVSPVEKEILMSDALIEELGIVILSPKTGLWRFTDDPAGKTRRSHKPPERY